MQGEKYRIKFILPNKGEAEGEIIRIKGPHLTDMLIRNLPLNSRGLKRESMFIIPINTLYNVEKPTTLGKQGDLVYDPKSKSLILLLESMKFDIQIANIGSITKNLDLFLNLKMSSGIRIEKID